jgi:hypothetical protein
MSQSRSTTEQVLFDLNFIGFSPAKLRDDIAKMPNVEVKDIEYLVAAYVSLGNNPKLSTDERRNKPTDKVEKVLNKYKTTLARIGIAYLPMTLAARLTAKRMNILKDQFPESKVDPVYQDVALSGWLGDQVKPFLIEFDKALASTGKASNHGLSAVNRWLNVSKNGFMLDVEVKSVMKENITLDEARAWVSSTLIPKPLTSASSSSQRVG